MAVRDVLLYPDPVLKRVCAPAPHGHGVAKNQRSAYIPKPSTKPWSC